MATSVKMEKWSGAYRGWMSMVALQAQLDRVGQQCNAEPGQGVVMDTMEYVARDRAAYKLAKEYLLGFSSEGVTTDLLESYLQPTQAQLRPPDLPGVYLRLLESAQNANMRAGVVGGALEGIQRLECV